MNYRYTVLILLYFLSTRMYPVSGQNLFVQKFTETDYKAGTNAEIASDKQGNIYIGNGDGLLTYDGTDWNMYHVPGNTPITTLAVDSTDRIYVGSREELGYFTKDSITGGLSYQSLLGKLEEKHKGVGNVYGIELFKGGVFFRDQSHVYYYKDDEFQVFDIEPIDFKCLFAVDNHFYLLGADENMYEYTEEGFKPLKIAPYIHHIWNITTYREKTALAVDCKDRLWLFNPSAETEHQWKPFPGTYYKHLGNEDHIYNIRFIRKDLIALFTLTNILFINESGEIVRKIGKEFLENFNYRDATLDANHNLWVCSVVYLLQISTSSPLSYFDNSNGFKGQVVSLAQKGDHSYVGTGWGFFYKKGQSAFSVFPQTYARIGWNFCATGKKLFAAHEKGVFEIKDNEASMIIEHLYTMSLCSIGHQDGDTLIMGTFDSGLWLLTKDKDKWGKTPIKGFDEETRYMLEDKEGNIWVSHYNKGVWKLRLNAKMDSVISQVFYDTARGLPSISNNRIYKLNADMAVATAQGVYRYHPESDRFVPDEKINKALGENICLYSLAATPDNDIYFWGVVSPGKERSGLLKKEKNGNYKLLTAPFEKITTSTRENLTDVEAPLYVTNNGDVWIGNKYRMVVYDPKQETFFEDPVLTHIKRIYARDSLIFTNGQGRRTQVLPYSMNKLNFEFGSTFHESAQKTMYQYRLDGFEDYWSAWSPDKNAAFTNLREGNYSFEVRAKNVYGRVSEPAYFNFTITAPWFRTLWAYLAYALLSGLFVYSLVALRTNRIKKQKELLKNEVDKKTRELRIKNEEIAKQAEELTELNFTKDKIFSIISHDLRGSINQLPQMFSLLESGDITQEEFLSIVPNLKENAKGLSNLTENLLFWAKCQMKGIEVKRSSFSLDQVIDENIRLSTPQAQRKNIRLILPEDGIANGTVVWADKEMIRSILRNLLNNAIKFTPKEGNIKISTLVDGGFVYVSIADSGIGISQEEISRIYNKEFFTKKGTAGEKGSGLGLMLCKEFAERNGGKLSIESTPGQGSTFTFSIPLEPKM